MKTARGREWAVLLALLVGNVVVPRLVRAGGRPDECQVECACDCDGDRPVIQVTTPACPSLTCPAVPDRLLAVGPTAEEPRVEGCRGTPKVRRGRVVLKRCTVSYPVGMPSP